MWGRKSFESNKSQLLRVHNAQNAEFEDHLSLLLMWFIRTAWMERVKFVEDLLNKTKGLNVIGNIINTTRGNVYKECIYIATQCETDNLFDKIIFDDNRTISSATFYEIREKDLTWFGNLSESRQFEVLMDSVTTYLDKSPNHKFVRS
ncbi:uncharacterized protein LOC123294563 [Chrysoperla carnea]|uniref:uncharacterized protein LOC123294563 n=1 Tax=Chrysoperla carnea TaxID=189513 RepID=UPI001D06FF71|nr:uncharacterized protein LOC123294563 [Chrysoperla carnea]